MPQASLVALSSFLCDAMEALHRDFVSGGIKDLQGELCGFFMSISHQIGTLHLDDEINTLLSDLNYRAREASSSWLAGDWDSDIVAMTSILWRLQAPPWVVAAAIQLHKATPISSNDGWIAANSVR